MTDHDALCFALKRTKDLKQAYAKVALSALADRVCDGKPIPGKVRLLLRAARQMRKERSNDTKN